MCSIPRINFRVSNLNAINMDRPHSPSSVYRSISEWTINKQFINKAGNFLRPEPQNNAPIPKNNEQLYQLYYSICTNVKTYLSRFFIPIQTTV